VSGCQIPVSSKPAAVRSAYPGSLDDVYLWCVGLLLGSARGAGALGAPGAVLSYLAVLNVILGTFNLRAPLTPAGSATAS